MKMWTSKGIQSVIFWRAGILVGCLVLSWLAAGEAQEDFQKKLEALLPGLESSDPTKLQNADRALEAMCLRAGRPGAEAERAGVAKALAARLGPEVPVGVRLLLVRQLQVIGGFESVLPLSKLLVEETDPLLRESARRALEANPTPFALRALRKAYEKATGDFRVALIQSLGFRRDYLSVGPLLEDALSENLQVRLAALDALAEIGDRAALDIFEGALRKGGPDDRRVREAYLRLAETMSLGDEPGAARRIYIRALKFEGGDRCAGLVGLGRTGIPIDAPALLEALSDPNPQVRAAAREGLAVLRRSTGAIVERIEGASAELRKDIALILGGRGDPAASKALAGLAGDESEEVRLAALEALGRMGGDGALAVLLDSFGKESAELRTIALQGLLRIAGEKAKRDDGGKKEAIGILQQILKAGPDPGTARQCADLLRRLGVDADSARPEGRD